LTAIPTAFLSPTNRHLLVDTLGLILTAVVHPASLQDRDG
jgi:hypothetical protein